MWKPDKVRLFIKPYCGWCHEAVDWLHEHQIDFEELDVTSDRKAYNEMVDLTGQTKAPCIEIDGEILADFDVDQLETFWNRMAREKQT